jgi:hypothetical protein
MKAGLPLVMMAPLMEASVAIFSTQAAKSRIEPSASTFIERPGMSQVTVAMPSPSISSFMFSMMSCLIPSNV